MKTLRMGIIGLVLLLSCESSWALIGVTLSNLRHYPLPPNPIKTWGKVKSVSPLKITDGRGEIQVNGLAASLGQFVVVTGNLNSNVLTLAVPINLSVCEMISIPAGSFLMGNSGVGNDAAYGYDSEFPQHSVTLSAYQIGKYEVTRGQYRQFITAGGYTNSSYWSSAGWSWKVSNGRTEPYYWAASQNWGSPPGAFTQTDNHPVVGVCYYEAEAFCNWAGGHLPTEAQWERAARWNPATSHPNVYPWGDAWNQEYCNNYFDTLYSLYQTSPVGSYSTHASPSGCQDMAGNVWEWCQDWYKSYPGSTSPFDYTNSYRVLRGGGWYLNVNYSRCAFRSLNYPYYCNNNVGFRLAR